MAVESIPVVNAASISRSLENATEAQLNSFFDNALHVGPFFISEQTATPHAEEKHLYGLDLNYSDINQPPYVGLGVNTMRLGWNLNALGRIDSDYSGIALSWEHRYTLNDNLDGVLVDEFHLLGTSRDAPPQDWRAFSIAKPQLAADATIQTDGAYISTESFALYRSNFTDNALKWQATWSPTGGTIAHSAGVGLLFDTPADGSPMMQQRDAAGVALLKLPYLDANETLKIDQPIIVAGGTNSVTGAFLDLTPSSATTGQKGIVLNGPAVTGTYYPVDLQATASTSLVQRLYNTSTAASRATFLAQSAAAEGVASSQYLDGTTGEGAECGWNSSEDRYIIGPWGLLTNTYAAISINPYPATTPTTTILGTCNLPITNITGGLTITPATANMEIIDSTGYSSTGADSGYGINLQGTWNTSGDPIFVRANLANTASGASALFMSLTVDSLPILTLSPTGLLTNYGGLSFSGTNHAGMRLISLTTAQRDALTPVNGDIIYNSTTSKIQAYAGGTWVDLH